MGVVAVCRMLLMARTARVAVEADLKRLPREAPERKGLTVVLVRERPPVAVEEPRRLVGPRAPTAGRAAPEVHQQLPVLR